LNASDSKQQQGNGDNKPVIARLLLVVVGMFGFGFALVPLYDVFCEVTGLNGKTGDRIELSEISRVDTSREVTVEFLASLNANMPWEFEPAVKAVRVNPGKPTKIEYVARNKTQRAIAGTAVPSVAPGQAATYFQKTECFCFSEQILQAGEEKHMPVVFVVDPELPEDVKTISLSYTFFIKPGTEATPLALNSYHQ